MDIQDDNTELLAALCLIKSHINGPEDVQSRIQSQDLHNAVQKIVNVARRRGLLDEFYLDRAPIQAGHVYLSREAGCIVARFAQSQRDISLKQNDIRSAMKWVRLHYPQHVLTVSAELAEEILAKQEPGQ